MTHRPLAEMSNSGVVAVVARQLTLRGLTGQRLLLAVSGGADSVALLRAVDELCPHGDVKPVVAHFNHRYRGAASEADADWVAALAERLEMPFVLGIAEQARVEDSAAIPEEAAREARYAFLVDAATSQRCAAILTAHTADDQVETVLHHVFRGTGLAGLGGIPAERELPSGIRLVRPLLDFTRSEVERHLHALGQDFRVDATNADAQMTRNWLRHTALPLLRERFPHLNGAVLRLAQQAVAAADIVGDRARQLLAATCLEESAETVRLRASDLACESPHLVREVFVQLWKSRDWPRQAMSHERWDQLAALVLTSDGSLTMPGSIEVRRRDDLVVISRRTA